MEIDYSKPITPAIKAKLKKCEELAKAHEAIWIKLRKRRKSKAAPLLYPHGSEKRANLIKEENMAWNALERAIFAYEKAEKP